MGSTLSLLRAIINAEPLNTDSNLEAAATPGLQSVLQALYIRTDVVPSLKLAIGGLIASLGIIEAATTNVEEYNKLTLELTAMARTLQEYLGELTLEDPSDNATCTRIALSINTEVAHIGNQQSRSNTWRVFMSGEDRDKIIQHYYRIESLFRQLLSDISLQTLKSINRQRVVTLIQGMRPVSEAQYNSNYSMAIGRRGCTEYTREQIQTTLQEWVQDPKGAKVYWMNGMAGTGKTTIAYSLCQWLEANGRLGASFFCSRGSLACQRVDLVIPTIAHQLARYSAAFRVALAKVLENDMEAAKLDVPQQFEKLIYGPMLAVKKSIPDSAVIVIDALDECGNDDSLKIIIGALLRPGANLPLKFFVTGRPEPVIYKEMSYLARYSPAVLHLHDIEQSIVEEDIKKYLAEALDSMSPSPSDSQIHQLAQQSGKLFIYAATVVRYILPGKAAADSLSRLMTILSPNLQQISRGTSHTMYRNLDDLYTAILTVAFGGLEEGEAETMRLVLWTVICAKESMSIPTLARILSLDEKRVTSVLQGLRSVLHVSNCTRLVSALHASFPDYMLDQSRSGNLCCDQNSHQNLLASQCFVVMREQLRFNICRLESSCIFDEDVQDLDQRIKRYISPELFYACQYWEEHLCKGVASYSLHDQLVDFLKLRMLFWLEVLNLNRCNTVNRTRSLLRIRHWLSKFGFPTETQQLVTDVYSFMTQFLITQCGRSTPHIYVSALSFCPESSSVYNHYWGKTRGLVQVQGVVASNENVVPLAIWRTNDLVTSLRFSVDGTRIVHGNICGTTYVRDAYTGNILAGPFYEFAREVCSVSLSPDGTRLAVSVDSRIVRVRDAHTGKIMAEPFNEVHHGLAGPIVVSPDATCIATGWKDSSIRLWDTYTGSPISKPLEGHTDRISSIAFSHDNTRIASGSSDATIRVWNASTGEVVAGPFLGHIRSISSISISPDGAYIVSGSADETVRVWDIAAGKGTIISYERGVPSVVFSPDGAFIAAGSDGTITIWDARTRGIVAGPLQVGSHIGLIRTVAFSPNNMRIAYSSTDAIRVWNWHLDVGNIPSTKGNWFTDNNGPLLCVPKRRYSCQMPHPRGTLLMGSRGTILVDYRRLYLGERWTKCFIS